MLLDHGSWYVLVKGELTSGEAIGTEFGDKPLSKPNPTTVTAKTDCMFICIETDVLEEIRLKVPHLNYELRKYRVNQSDPAVDWIMGVRPVN